MLKTVKFRIKDKNTSKELDLMAREVKFVWNILNSAARKKWNESRQYFHKFDPYFTSIFKGASKELRINSQTIQAIIEQFHKDIKQQRKQLKWKGRKSPKWIPFKGQTIKVLNDSISYDGNKFRFWKTLKIKGKIKTGSFNCDVTGRWFVNLTYEAELKQSSGVGEIGVDLGLKTTATCSNGKELKLKELDWIDRKIAREQMARNFKKAKVLHLKKSNIRKDKINKFALDLVRTNNLIAIGNISGFTKGKNAKSRYQNSWSLLKKKLEFKCLEYGVSFLEIPENFTTQTCNACGSIEGPKGIKGLRVRFWKCTCGAELSRDINASINILNRAKCLAS